MASGTHPAPQGATCLCRRRRCRCFHSPVRYSTPLRPAYTAHRTHSNNSSVQSLPAWCLTTTTYDHSPPQFIPTGVLSSIRLVECSSSTSHWGIRKIRVLHPSADYIIKSASTARWARIHILPWCDLHASHGDADLYCNVVIRLRILISPWCHLHVIQPIVIHIYNHCLHNKGTVIIHNNLSFSRVSTHHYPQVLKYLPT